MSTRLAVVILIIVVIIVGLIVRRAPVHPEPQGPAPIATIAYACNGEKSLTATYYQGESRPSTSSSTPPTPGGSVALNLSDGRRMTLPQTISADGIRFANADESFVFWSKGNGALVLENNQQKSYIGCIAVAPASAGQDLPLVYQNSGDGFSIRLPQGYSVDESYTPASSVAGKDIFKVNFVIASSTTAGTNLANDSSMSVEAVSYAQNCTAGLFFDGNVVARKVIDGGVTYSVASSTDAAAGNRYEETVYALPGTNPCIGVRYFVHYGAIENYPQGTVQSFNKAALIEQFDAIRRTLIVVQ